MYQFKEDWSRDSHFWFDKKLIEDKNWAALPQSSKAIYPVIGCHTDEKGEAFPGESLIAILSGLTEKTVRSGIVALEDFPHFKTKRYVTKRGKSSRKFNINPPPNIKGRAFPLYRGIIDTGNWLHLIPTAKALYPVMRHFSFFDENLCMLYADLENDESFDPTEFGECYPRRKWEFCEADTRILAAYAGISTKSLPTALGSLERHSIIETYSDESFDGWKVFLHPPNYYKRDYLNQMILDKYPHLKVAQEKITGHSMKI